MAVVLWHLELSHYNEKARWALDYKRVPHVRKAPMPGLHGFRAALLTRSPHRRLPVLELDGRGIGDSTAIIAALEKRFPEPPLYPADPEQRARALELEEFFDERLAPAVRAFIWQHTLEDTDAVVDSVLPHGGKRRRAAMRAMLPLARPAIRRDFGASIAKIEVTRERIRAGMDRLEREIGTGGYLAGDAFSVADLTAAALFTPLLSAPGRQYPPATLPSGVLALREELEQRPGAAWVSEMFRRHRGSSAAVSG